MTLYTVHAPAADGDDRPSDPAALVFVKEGFCWPALFVPELWLIVRRQWLLLLGYIAAIAAFAALGRFVGGELPWLVMLLARFLFALEANGLRRWTMERHGFRLVGMVEAHGLAEAELRFFSDWPATGPAAAPAASVPSSAPPAPAQPAPAPAVPPRAAAVAVEPWRPTPENGGVVGLFPAPGGTR